MTYDLDLCDMDEGDDIWQDAAEWTVTEERRRLFWVVWELDAFVSTFSRHPSAINRQRVAAHLPVKSAPLSTRPSEAGRAY